MTTRIILTVWDSEKRPYMGVFDFDHCFYPRLNPKGGLGEYPLEDGELEFLINLAGTASKTWLPADSHKDPLGCVPFWIHEAVWAQLDAGQPYYKFCFKPPLEIQYAAQVSGVGLAPIKEASR